jgi:hypothetical protein
MSNDLEARVAAIELRNKKVEADKAWETSWVRRLSIAILTYIIIAVFLLAIDKPQPFINALVPPIGYLLSTLVMRQVRSIWQSERVNNGR